MRWCSSNSACFMNLFLFLFVYLLPDSILYLTMYSSYNALCRLEDVYIVCFFRGVNVFTEKSSGVTTQRTLGLLNILASALYRF